MEVYLFSAATLTNIWAGVGARMWAVSSEQAANSSILGKAKKFQIGSVGLFYCVEQKAVTTPFLVVGRPILDGQISNVWPGNWRLPFDIVPFGSPHKQLPVSVLSVRLPSLAGGRPWTDLFHYQPVTVFAASQIQREDWAVLVSELAHG